MITYLETSLFASPAQVLVNTVNTIGVMGRGLAKEFKDIYPEMFAIYSDLCKKHEIQIGTLLLYQSSNKWVLNFPTKHHFRYPSKLEFVESGLQSFVSSFADHGLTSVAFPQLGCGTGGLDWEGEVRPLMEHYLRPLPIDTYIHVVRDRRPISPAWTSTERKERLRGELPVVPFSAFLVDLMQVAKRSAAMDPHEEQQSWASGEEDDGSAFLFLDGERQVTLQQDDLRAIWQQLQSFGLVAKDNLPLDDDSDAELVFDSLARLDYLKRAQWSGDWDKMRMIASSGLQFVPPYPRAATDRTISASSGKVERWNGNQMEMPLQSI